MNFQKLKECEPMHAFGFPQVKDPVRKYLPPDEPATRKIPLYRAVFDGFDRIDGKPTESERKVRNP